MRTLQEKYNGIQEGKFSKENFLADARKELPNLVTRFNGYDDAVQILKNRGMIQEARVEEARLTKNNLTDYRYKPTNEMDKYPYEQILRGLRVELETMDVYGTPTAEEYAKALAKVSKNLAKDSIFYTNQLAGVNPKVDLHDKMVDATAKNTVDTFNGMKKIKDLKEDHSKNPDDKYTVRPCKTKGEPWAVWEGEKRVKGFVTKAEAKEYADSQNKKQGLTENVLKEGIKNLIKKVLMENEEDVYELYTDEEDEIDYDDENFSDPMIDGEEEDDIPHPYGYEEASDEESFEDLFEETDTEADKNMVRKLMTMYETEPSKFEKLHKQAQTQASTSKDIKFKHLLSLIDRAKAGALQSLSNQDKRQADSEGMDEIATDITGFPKWRELGQDEKDRIGTFVKDTGDRDQAEYERARKERLAAQSAQLAKHIAGDKNLQEVRKAKSLSELLK
jgi:hypothetical protein